MDFLGISRDVLWIFYGFLGISVDFYMNLYGSIWNMDWLLESDMDLFSGLLEIYFFSRTHAGNFYR